MVKVLYTEKEREKRDKKENRIRKIRDLDRGIAGKTGILSKVKGFAMGQRGKWEGYKKKVANEKKDWSYIFGGEKGRMVEELRQKESRKALKRKVREEFMKVKKKQVNKNVQGGYGFNIGLGGVEELNLGFPLGDNKKKKKDEWW